MTVNTADASPRRHFVQRLWTDLNGFVDDISKKSPYVGKIKDRTLQVANTYIPLEPLLNRGIEIADGTVDKVLDTTDVVVQRVRDISGRVVNDSKEKKVKFVAAACDAWARIHQRPGPVSFAELQAYLKAVYQEQVAEPFNKAGAADEPVLVRVLRFATEKIECIVDYTEVLVDGKAEGTLAKHSSLNQRAWALTSKIPRKVVFKMNNQLRSISVRSQEVVKSIVHVDLIAYASGKSEALAQYAKLQSANVMDYVKSTSASIPAQIRLADPAKRAQLKAALAELMTDLRGRVQPLSNRIVPYTKKTISDMSVHVLAAFESLSSKIPPEQRELLAKLYARAYKKVRETFGDKWTDEAVHIASQYFLASWIFASPATSSAEPRVTEVK